MTAKQALLEYVAGLTEEEAEEKLPWIVGPVAQRTLTPAERASIERGLADARAGRLIPLEELEAEFEAEDL